MRITHFGHACLLVESTNARILVDPGSFSQGFEQLRDLDAILVTHQHPDHFDAERGPALVAANPVARLMIEPETAAAFGMGGDAVFASGSEVQLADLSITGVGGRHAVNHERAPTVGNVGFVIEAAGGLRLFHPGDAYDESPDGIDVLALPVNAPWCRVSETLEFFRTISPAKVVPIHTGLLSEAGLGIYLTHVGNFGPAGAELVDLPEGIGQDFGQS